MHIKKNLIVVLLCMAGSNVYGLTDQELMFRFASEPALEFLNFSEVKGTLHRVVPVDAKKLIESQNLTETNLVSDQDSLQQAKGFDFGHQSDLTELSSTVPAFQTNPFDTPIDVNLKGPNTVGDAIGKILRYIGYDLKKNGVGVDPTASLLFSKRLPNIHRRFSNVTVKEAVCALIGSGYTVVVDNAIRVVSADISPEKRRIQTMEERLKGSAL